MKISFSAFRIITSTIGCFVSLYWIYYEFFMGRVSTQWAFQKSYGIYPSLLICAIIYSLVVDYFFIRKKRSDRKKQGWILFGRLLYFGAIITGILVTSLALLLFVALEYSSSYSW